MEDIRWWRGHRCWKLGCGWLKHRLTIRTVHLQHSELTLDFIQMKRELIIKDDSFLTIYLEEGFVPDSLICSSATRSWIIMLRPTVSIQLSFILLIIPVHRPASAPSSINIIPIMPIRLHQSSSFIPWFPLWFLRKFDIVISNFQYRVVYITCMNNNLPDLDKSSLFHP
jgi:hypothetical protein